MTGRPPIVLTKLWKRTSKRGQVYLAGRIGALRILVMARRDTNGDSDHTHEILLAEIDPDRPSVQPSLPIHD